MVLLLLPDRNQRLMSLLNRLKFDLTVDEPASSPPALPSDLPRNLNEILLDKVPVFVHLNIIKQFSPVC